MKSFLICCIVLYVSVFSGEGQTSKCQKSTEGKDFWLSFMEGRTWDGQHYTEITLSSRYDCSYEIYIGKSTTASISGKITANVPSKIPIDWHLAETIGSEQIQEKAVHIVSLDNPFNVYALNYSDNSSEIALVYPTESLGKEYYTMCYDPHYAVNNTGYILGKNSEFLIVATQNNTNINITPSAITDKQQSSIHIILNQGEVYQVQAGNNPTRQDSIDLTGSYITSDHPVAVFSGSYSTSVPKTSNNAWDHLFEQMPPVQSWGSIFAAIPLATRGVTYYRVLAKEDNTTVKVGNLYTYILKKGDWKEFTLTQPLLIESTHPVLLAQFSPSNSEDKPPGAKNWDGDPFMVIVSSINQTRDKVAFVAYDSKRITSKFFINVVVKDDAVGKIVLDGSPVNFTSLPNSGYSYAQVSISSGNHYIESTEEGKGFIGYVYGFGGVEAYGYGVGYSLDITLDLGGLKDPLGNKYLVRCDGADSLSLNAGNAFNSFSWNTGATSSQIRVADAGTYWVKASTSSGCEQTDTVNLIVSKPIINLGPDTTICNPENLLLDANLLGKFDQQHDPVMDFTWITPADTVKNQQITASIQGVYSVSATTFTGCSASDQLQVMFTDKPRINALNLDSLICGKKSAVLGLAADKGSYTLERSDNGEIFSNLTVSVPDFGTFPFKFTATDPFGCSSDTTFKVRFHKTPTVSFSIDSTKCYRYNLSADYIGDAAIDASRFTWVFGKDTIADGLGIHSSIVPLGVNQRERNLSLQVTEEGCSNADTIKDIKVIPDLKVQVTDTLGCQPFKTQFLAQNTEEVTYDWDFGDGIREQSDDHPVHTYQKDGYYNLKLKVTTEKGCTNSVSIDSILYVAPIPTAGFSLDPAVCLQNKDNELVYSGTGDQQDTYNWDLTAFEPAEIIKDPGKTQGPFLFNLKNKPQAPLALSVTSKYGCKSDTAHLLLKRKPSFTFSALNSKGCVPLETQFLTSQNDLVDKISYAWDFGDGSSGTGDQASHIYNQQNQHYSPVISAFSELTGCSDTLRKDTLVFVYPKPVAAFSLDHSIVYNDQPDVHFENQSQGANHYLWDFGDGSTSADANPSNKFKGHGDKKVLLTALNDYECSDTTSQNVLVAFNRIFPPNAFSPNAPNPVDREFKLGQEAIKEEGYHLVILSRWNDIVFETKNQIRGWDGRMKNGENAPAGSYVWILDFVDFLGRVHHQNGTLTLIY